MILPRLGSELEDFNIQSFLLATGERDDLHPLTENLPSPLLPIANRPVMVQMIELLVRYGMKEILVGLQRSSGDIDAYLGSGQRWDVGFETLLQRQALGTAGAIKRAERMLTKTFLLMPADAIIDLDIQAALLFHFQHQGMATMILGRSFDDNGTLAEPVHVDQAERVNPVGFSAADNDVFFNTGAYIFEPQIFDHIPPHTAYDCYSQLIPQLMAAGEEVFGFVSDGYWNRLDSIQAYQNAQLAMLHSLSGRQATTDGAPAIRYPYVEGYEFADGVWYGQSTVLHPSAKIVAPVIIGAGCQIGRDVEIGPEVVIGANSIIDEGATIVQSTVIHNSYIGKLVNVDRKIVQQSCLIDIHTADALQVTDHFLLAEAAPSVSAAIVRTMFEKILALGLIIGLAPLLAMIALMTWFTLGRPILVRELRIGRSPLGRKSDSSTTPHNIYILRFRTRNDGGSYTAIGRFLENTELHRIPELFSVVGGTIGLIGVKPLSINDAELVTDDWQRKRYECQAGFTGLWYTQVEAGDDFDATCMADTYQAAMHTYRDELLQLWRTPITWLKKRKRTRHTLINTDRRDFAPKTYPRYVDANPKE